jgi:enamine deaminase RidA (YjgF/YER057c/UK114 family)
MERRSISSQAPWEPVIGYSRGVRVGPHVHVAGTTAWDEHGKIVSVGDPYGQALQTLRNIERALGALDAAARDVVRTRIYVTNMDDWEQVAKAHCEFFGAVRPVNTIVEVPKLVVPEMLVEIEAEAIVAGAQS